MKHLTILLTLLLATSVWAESWSPDAKGFICTWEKENKTYDYQPSSRILIDVDKEKIKHVYWAGELDNEDFNVWGISWRQTGYGDEFMMSLNRETLELRMQERILDNLGIIKQINDNTAKCEMTSAQAILDEVKEKKEKYWEEIEEMKEEQRKKNKF